MLKLVLMASAALLARDLDVAIPSGAPLEWKSALPQRYVRPEPSFALTRDRDDGRYAPARTRTPVRGVGVMRPDEVLTLDFASHLGFDPPDIGRNLTGAGANERPYPPRPDIDLYWRTTVALLQLLLHPARVLRLEVLGHLMILGEGALPGLEAAASMGELADDARAVREAIGKTPPHPPDPPNSLAARDPFATMMQRFVAQELCLARPYASDLLFAERLILLRDDVVPALLPFLASDHSLARRNAVALLALLDTPAASDALVRVLSTSDDPVARLRAIHGLVQRGSRNAAPALRSALAAGPEPILAAALIRALGELGDPEAIPLLLTLEGPGSARAELLIERLTALAQIDAGARRDAVETFVRPWLDVAGNEAAWLKRQDARPPERPDQPDPADLRARTVEQLARLIVARLHPDDADRRAAALKPFQETPAPRGALDRFPCAAMGDVASLNRFVFVQALSSLGPAAVDRLRQIAHDATCEPELRMAAVEALPLTDRLGLAAELARDPAAEMSLRLAALELLDLFNDERTVPAADELGRAAGFELRNVDDPMEHWRLLITVQALGRRNRVTTPELVTLLQSVDPRRAKHADPLVLQAKNFVEQALRIGRKNSELREVARGLLRSLAPAPRSRGMGWDTFDEDVNALVGLVDAALDHPNSAKVREATTRSIASYLEIFVARASPVGSARSDAFAQVPLLETVLMELARKADQAALDALSTVLHDPSHPGRAIACVALGATSQPAAGPILLYALKDDDPFVRLCAYLGLRHLTGQDFFADWLAGDSRELDKAFQEWGGWIVRHAR